jgi:hypothetical protein
MDQSYPTASEVSWESPAHCAVCNSSTREVVDRCRETAKWLIYLPPSSGTTAALELVVRTNPKKESTMRAYDVTVPFQAIDLDHLSAITGGAPQGGWTAAAGRVLNAAGNDAQNGAAIGGVGGAVVGGVAGGITGSAAGGVGAIPGAAAGAWSGSKVGAGIGAVAGGAWGLGRGLGHEAGWW